MAARGRCTLLHLGVVWRLADGETVSPQPAGEGVGSDSGKNGSAAVAVCAAAVLAGGGDFTSAEGRAETEVA